MHNYLLNQNRRYKYLMFFGDLILIVIGILLSYSIKVYIDQGHMNFNILLRRLDFWHIIIIPLHLFSLYVFDLYNFDRMINTMKLFIMIFISVLLAGILLSGVFFFVPKYVFGRQVLLIHLCVLSLLLVIWRLFCLKNVSGDNNRKKIALICKPNTALHFKKELSRICFNRIEISHICHKSSKGNYEKNGIKYYNSLPDLLMDNSFDILVFDSSNEKFSHDEIRLILETKQKGRGVYELSNLYINITGKVPLEFIDGRWLMNSQEMQGMINKPYIQIKRFLDVSFACSLILLLSPFIFITALLVKFESNGDIIFSQERLGQNRQPFTCYKFRTMLANAEDKTGPIWAKTEDQRVTKLGKILRKSRLDELPQLWNIIKGDISFVGPRPIRKYFADQLSKESSFYELRFSVQPGLSGWAQVHGCYAVPYGEKALKYELFYIQNMSLLLDIIVILKTVQSFIKVEGK